MARPHDCTLENTQEICERIATGESVRRICMDKHMPADKTIYRWLYCQTTGPDDPREMFREAYRRARLDMLTTWANDIIDISDGLMPVGEEERQGGETEKDRQHRLTNRDRLRVETRKWVMSRVKPEMWGDKVQHIGEGGGPIRHGLTPALAEAVDAITDAREEAKLIELKPDAVEIEGQDAAKAAKATKTD